MNLILRPHTNLEDPTWSVIISLAIFLVGVLYYVVYILNMSLKEMSDVQESKQGEEGICGKQEAESGECHGEES